MPNYGNYYIGIRLLLLKEYLQANAGKDRIVKRKEIEKHLTEKIKYGILLFHLHYPQSFFNFICILSRNHNLLSVKKRQPQFPRYVIFQ